MSRMNLLLTKGGFYHPNPKIKDYDLPKVFQEDGKPTNSA
jgi:hypothetical protein